MNKRGLFISFEGTEGSGKSTQIRLLGEYFEALGRKVCTTREPGGTPLCEEIRRLLQYAPEGRGMCPETELFLFAASRAQLVRAVIEPALARGEVVLSDRFLDSTTVYQGVARRLEAEQVGRVNALAVGQTLPDLTVLLDLPAQEGLARAQKRRDAPPDRMEQEALAFYEAVRQGYLELARAQKERFLVVDATKSPETVFERIRHGIEERCKR